MHCQKYYYVGIDILSFSFVLILTRFNYFRPIVITSEFLPSLWPGDTSKIRYEEDKKIWIRDWLFCILSKLGNARQGLQIVVAFVHNVFFYLLV